MFGESGPRLPLRVQAAYNFAQWMGSQLSEVTNAMGTSCEPRSLTREESAAHRAALEVLRLYFSGECSFAEEGESVPETPRRKPPEPGPATPAPEPVLV